MAATMISTREFLPYILPHAPGAPAVAAEFAARNASAEFCRRTKCWREVLTAAVTTNEPVIIGPDYATIFRIETAFYVDDSGNLTELEAMPFIDLPADWAQAEGPPSAVFQRVPDTVLLYPFAPGDVEIDAFLTPRGGSDFTQSFDDAMSDYYNQVPDFLAIKHAETIGFGALWRVLMTPQKPWTDPTMAASFKALFDQACDQMFDTSTIGQHRAYRRVRYNDF